MAKRWMCVLLPLLPCQRLIRQRPQLRRKPFVVIEQIGNKIGVVTASPAARKMGVRIGMTLAAARALAPSMPAIDRQMAQDALALESIANWAQGFGPYVALYSDEAIVVEVGGSASLFDGEEALIRQVQRRALKLGYMAKVSIADTPRAAHALCVAGYSRVADAGLLEGLPLASLSLDAGMLEGFEALGIRSLDALLALPRTMLASRYGRELLNRLAAFEGSVEELPSRHEPSSADLEEVEFDAPVEDGRGLDFVLKRLVDRLSERLRATGLGARRLRLAFRFEQEEQIEEVGLAEASGSAKAWLMLLRSRLEAIGGLAPLYTLRLEVLESGPIKGAQRQLFTKRVETQDEAFTALLGRLSARLGPSQVMRPELREAFLPEEEWRGAEVLAKPEKLEASLLPQRPGLLFPRPRALRVECRESQPLSIYGKPLSAVEGPERVLESWLDGGQARDYWQATLINGERIWIYRDHADGHFYQHGVFA